MKILIVEDEKEILEGIKAILESDGYEVDAAYDGVCGLDHMLSDTYDLVLLDIMLPYMDGIEVLKRARENGIKVPVIILTAKYQTDDKVAGLDSGADDYLTKPFDAEELLARIRAQTRKNSLDYDNQIRAFDIYLDKKDFKLYGSKKNIKLGKKEYQLLEYLILNKGQILTRDMLIERIWGLDDETNYNNLDVYISFLRKKMKYIDSKSVIVTKKGVGYSLEEGEER